MHFLHTINIYNNITLNSGIGFPLQRLLNDHVQCLIVFFVVAFYIIVINGSTPPTLNIRSLYYVQSPAILPIAQTAYSAISLYYELNNLTNKYIPPLSIIDYVYYVVPLATLVKAHAASRTNYGTYYSFYIISINFGTKFASITYYIGAPDYDLNKIIYFYR